MSNVLSEEKRQRVIALENWAGRLARHHGSEVHRRTAARSVESQEVFPTSHRSNIGLQPISGTRTKQVEMDLIDRLGPPRHWR
jgi:hypothetical protein